jgi:hypothetical protein
MLNFYGGDVLKPDTELEKLFAEWGKVYGPPCILCAYRAVSMETCDSNIHIQVAAAYSKLLAE